MVPLSVFPVRDTGTGAAPAAGLANVFGVKLGGFSHWCGAGSCLVMDMAPVGGERESETKQK